jgi:tetratricopeptide (TPR) repeat protein
MVYYLLGYYSMLQGDEPGAKSYALKASEQPYDYCFPFRLGSIRILEEASRINPEDPRAPFYLGNLLFDMQPHRAMEEWKKSVGLDDSFWLVHRNLGMAYNILSKDSPAAIEHYRKAIELKPDDQRLLFELDLIYAAAREDPNTRLKLLQDHHLVIANNNVSDALSREIMILVQLERYEQALQVLEENTFKQWEGISKAYNSYVDAHLFLGWDLLHQGNYNQALSHMELAGQFPENMMVAKPYRGGRSGQVYYFTGLVYEANGEEKKAEEYFKLCLEERQSLNLNENHYFKALALEKLGMEEEATKIYDQLIELGNRRLKSTEPDFFAKFGEQETQDDKLSNAYYLLGLGYAGKKQDKEAEKMFAQAVKLNINHIWAARYLSELNR